VRERNKNHEKLGVNVKQKTALSLPQRHPWLIFSHDPGPVREGSWKGKVIDIRSGGPKKDKPIHDRTNGKAFMGANTSGKGEEES